jgi:hypothetical protein
MAAMVTRGIREFMARPWDARRDDKDRYWAERIVQLGAAEGFRIAGELGRQARLVDPEWPRPDDRDRDLASHVRLAELFRRADAAGCR